MDWLKNEKSPKILVNAVSKIGIKEIVGTRHNPVIMGWAKTLNIPYQSDEVPWCGLFMAIVAHESGLDVVRGPLWARNWANWGNPQRLAMLGDVLVFSRTGGSGHVGIYVGEDSSAYFVLGGNQGNSVSVTRILKSRCIAIRRTKWKIAQPSNVRQIFIDKKMKLSINEA